MRRQRPKYEKPLRPYDRNRINNEKRILEQYGLKRKREIWRAENILRNIRRQTRDLIASYDEQRENELRNRLVKIGLVSEDDPLEGFLSLELEDLLDRRLQTVIFKKGLANTPKQARQYIVHGHIAVDGQKVSYPSYLVPKDLEMEIGFYERSSLKGSEVEKAKETVKEEKEKVEGKPAEETQEEDSSEEQEETDEGESSEEEKKDEEQEETEGKETEESETKEPEEEDNEENDEEENGEE